MSEKTDFYAPNARQVTVHNHLWPAGLETVWFGIKLGFGASLGVGWFVGVCLMLHAIRIVLA